MCSQSTKSVVPDQMSDGHDPNTNPGPHTVFGQSERPVRRKRPTARSLHAHRTLDLDLDPICKPASLVVNTHD
jgi:hypothetical protein